MFIRSVFQQDVDDIDVLVPGRKVQRSFERFYRSYQWVRLSVASLNKNLYSPCFLGED